MIADMEYKSTQEKIASLLISIRAELEVHNKDQKQNTENWCYVGDVQHVFDGLQEIHGFLTNRD